MRELFHGEDGSYVLLGGKGAGAYRWSLSPQKMAVRPLNEKPPKEGFLLTNGPGFRK